MGSSLSNESADELIQKACSLIRAELIDRRVAVHPVIGEVDELNELGRCVVSAATLLDVGNDEVLQNMVYADGDEPPTVDELVADADGYGYITKYWRERKNIEKSSVENLCWLRTTKVKFREEGCGGSSPYLKVGVSATTVLMKDAVWAMYYNEEFCFAAKETPIACPLYQMKLMNEEDILKLEANVFVLSCVEYTLYCWKDIPDELDLFECIIVAGKEKATRLQKILQSKKDVIVFDTSEKRAWTANGEQILAQLWSIPLLSSRYRIVFQEEVGKDGFISMQDILSILDQNRFVRDSVINIYTDGSTWRKSWFAGWAFAVYQDGKEVCHKENVFPIHPAEVKHATIISEYTAVLHALDYIIEAKPRKAVIYYDCVMVVTGGFSNVKDHVEAHYRYKECLKKKLDSLRRIGVDVAWKKVEAHVGHMGNERVDTLAREAVRKAEEYFLAGTTIDDWYNPHNLIYDKRLIKSKKLLRCGQSSDTI